MVGHRRPELAGAAARRSDPLDQPRELRPARTGGGGRATEGTGAACRPRPRAGLEGLAEHRHRGRRRRSTWPTSTGRARSSTSGSPPTPTTGARCCCGRTGTATTSPPSRCRSATSSAAAGASSRSVSSLPVAVNPHGGFNCYWPMPFRRRRPAHASRTSAAEPGHGVYYQINYALGDDARTTRLPARPVAAQQPAALPATSHTLLDGVAGRGHYVGTYLAWGVNNTGWWGEGEIKFYLDGDDEFPTICGTGTEDYFGGAWNFDVPGQGYTAYSHAVPRAAAGHPAGRALRAASSASACTAGTSRTRSASQHGPARRHPGARLALRRRATCRCRTTSPRPRCSTSTARDARGPPAPTADAMEIG